MSPSPHSDLEAQDADELAQVAAWLEQNRPVPSTAFRGDLRRHLMGSRQIAQAAPRRLWALAAGSFGGGAALLVVALLGVAGTGPFAA